MHKNEKIRESVSKFYTKAVKQPSENSCCSGSCTPQGVVTQTAGYTPKETEDLPSDAVTHAFGCGNPVALGELKEGDVVVDLGSGAGIDILLAGKKVGPGGRVIGIDMTDEMISRAQKNITESGLKNVEARKGIIEDLPVESNSVDWVISNCVINLSPDKPKVFSEIARVLKPGGRMLISDIVVEDLPDWIRQNQALYSSCVAGAVSEGDYVNGLKKAGLSHVEVRDRLVYDGSQIKGLIESELPEASEALNCLDKKSLEQLTGSVTGKIWSALFFARKL